MDIIQFKGHEVLILNQDGTPWDGEQEAWFIPKQVAAAIEAVEPDVYARKILSRNPEKFEGFRSRTKLVLEGVGVREINIINENGLYMFLFSSELPMAVDFQREVSELIKRIRQGKQVEISYSIEDGVIVAMQGIKQLREENAILKVQQAQTKQELNHLKVVVDNEVWLTENQKAQIQEAVKKRSGHLQNQGYPASFQGIYSALKTHFEVPKYDKIKRKDFEHAMDFIRGWYPPKKTKASN